MDGVLQEAGRLAGRFGKLAVAVTRQHNRSFDEMQEYLVRSAVIRTHLALAQNR